MLITVNVPDEMASSFGPDDLSRSRKVLEMLLLQQYVAGEISGGWLGKALGMGFHEREQFLHDHKAFQPYTPEDHANDAEAIERLLSE